MGMLVHPSVTLSLFNSYVLDACDAVPAQTTTVPTTASITPCDWHPELSRSHFCWPAFLFALRPNNDFWIFGLSENLTRLCFADVVCMDGTFDACPASYKKLLTIHAFNAGTSDI